MREQNVNCTQSAMTCRKAFEKITRERGPFLCGPYTQSYRYNKPAFISLKDFNKRDGMLAWNKSATYMQRHCIEFCLNIQSQFISPETNLLIGSLSDCRDGQTFALAKFYLFQERERRKSFRGEVQPDQPEMFSYSITRREKNAFKRKVKRNHT